jgi:DNA-binding NtrC family response regulator
LRNVIERALIESRGGTIRAEHIHCGGLHAGVRQTVVNDSVETAAPGIPPVNLKDAEAAMIRQAIASSGGNIAEAARQLGVNRPKLYRMMAAHSIDSN